MLWDNKGYWVYLGYYDTIANLTKVIITLCLKTPSIQVFNYNFRENLEIDYKIRLADISLGEYTSE